MKTETEVGRYELKYLVPVSRRDQIRSMVSRHAESDPHARPLADGTLGYQVHSLYFDTRDLHDYFERLDRRRIRNRLRIRTYGQAHESQPVFLENKRKSGRWVVKHRAHVTDTKTWFEARDPYPWRPFCNNLSGGSAFAAHSFMHLVEKDRRHPVTAVHYDREVFIDHRNTSRRVRLTLDRNVRAAATDTMNPYFDRDAVELVPPQWMVLEMKFQGSAPQWMIELRRMLEIAAMPVSKFGLSVARTVRSAHHRELRSLMPPPLLRMRWSA